MSASAAGDIADDLTKTLEDMAADALDMAESRAEKTVFNTNERYWTESLTKRYSITVQTTTSTVSS